jgi:AcrR family transcriptional regulator
LVPRKTDTRERLITTAAELFRRQGYAQTGVNQIIQEANATSGSFYHFFSAKEDLLLAVVDHLAENFTVEIFDVAADQADDPITEIFTILGLYRRQLESGGLAISSPMASLSAEVSENHPQVRARLAEVFASWTGRIEELLRNAGNRLPPSLDRSALAQLVVCTTEGAVLGTRLNRSLAPFDAAIAQLRIHFDLLEDRMEAPGAVVTAARPAPATPPRTADWRSW